jgi:hypothetical protein
MKVNRSLSSLIKILGGWRTHSDPDVIETKEEVEEHE